MKRKIFKEPMLILVGIVVIVFLSVTGVIAFRYFQTYMEPIKHEDIIPQNIPEREPEVIVQDEIKVPPADNIPSSIPFESEKPEKPSSAKEEIASVRHEDDGVIYIYLSSDSNSFSEYRRSDAQKNQIVSKTTQKVDSTALSPTPKSSPDSYTAAPLTSNSTEYSPPKETYHSWDSGNGSSTENEDYQDDGRNLNYNVSVSRGFISGSFYEGKIDVVLSIYVDSIPPNGLIVKEYVPKGWEVVESSPAYKNFNPSTGEVKWLFIGTDVRNMEINYKVVERETSPVGTSFRGTYLYNNPDGKHVTMQIGGANGV